MRACAHGRADSGFEPVRQVFVDSRRHIETVDARVAAAIELQGRNPVMRERPVRGDVVFERCVVAEFRNEAGVNLQSAECLGNQQLRFVA
jgi:hypothetical protein